MKRKEKLNSMFRKFIGIKYRGKTRRLTQLIWVTPFLWFRTAKVLSIPVHTIFCFYYGPTIKFRCLCTNFCVLSLNTGNKKNDDRGKLTHKWMGQVVTYLWNVQMKCYTRLLRYNPMSEELWLWNCSRCQFVISSSNIGRKQGNNHTALLYFYWKNSPRRVYRPGC